MTEAAHLYDLLAGLFRYPDGKYGRRIEICRQAFLEAEPEVAALLAEFAARTQELSTEEREELFTSTFDLNPVCTLDLGWHLFGEEFARGRFLVWMREELRRQGLEESTELPDHLTHVLAVLGRMETQPAAEFAAACVLPALEKMLAALAGKNNPYEKLLQAVARLVTLRQAAVFEEVNHD